MTGQFDIQPFERKPLPRIILPPLPEAPARKAPPLPPSRRKRNRRAPRRASFHRALANRLCKICGQPACEQTKEPLCAKHEREARNADQRRWHAERTVKAGLNQRFNNCVFQLKLQRLYDPWTAGRRARDYETLVLQGSNRLEAARSYLQHQVKVCREEGFSIAQPDPMNPDYFEVCWVDPISDEREYLALFLDANPPPSKTGRDLAATP